jgi:hypothetical protein
MQRTLLLPFPQLPPVSPTHIPLSQGEGFVTSISQARHICPDMLIYWPRVTQLVELTAESPRTPAPPAHQALMSSGLIQKTLPYPG